MKTHIGHLETLSPEELKDLEGSSLENQVLSGYIDYISKHLILFRGESRKCLVVPFDYFTPSGIYSPDFDQFSIIDWGGAIKLGNYEVGVNNIFKEFDKEN